MLRKSSELSIKDFYCAFVGTEMNLIAFSGPRNCVNTQPYLELCQISFNSILKSISKIFIPNFVFVLTNERYITYQTGFQFCCLGHAPGVGLSGTGGAEGGQIFFFQS